MRAALLSVALALLASAAPRVVAQVPIPKLESRVTDLTGTLTAQQQSALEEKLKAFEDRKGAQIAVLIVPSTQPEDIAQFGVRLMETWKLGRAGVDDGAALIVAKDDRELRIEVQYGLEGVLTDATTNRIIEDTIVPLFKQGDFYGGINAGVDQMLRVVDGEALPEPDRAWKNERQRNMPWSWLIFLVVASSTFLNRVAGRLGGASIIGAVCALLGWWLTSRWLFVPLGFIGGFLVALLFGAGGGGMGSGRVFRDMGRGGGWGGGGFGGGGGGWSGGGGRGGGGGASGRW